MVTRRSSEVAPQALRMRTEYSQAIVALAVALALHYVAVTLCWRRRAAGTTAIADTTLVRVCYLAGMVVGCTGVTLINWFLEGPRFLDHAVMDVLCGPVAGAVVGLILGAWWFGRRQETEPGAVDSYLPRLLARACAVRRELRRL